MPGPNSGKSRQRRAKQRRPVVHVTRTNLPKPQELVSEMFLAVIDACRSVKLPTFAGVNFMGDAVLGAAVFYGIVPTIERLVTPRAPEVVVPAVLSAIATFFAVLILCVLYVVVRSPRWR